MAEVLGEENCSGHGHQQSKRGEAKFKSLSPWLVTKLHLTGFTSREFQHILALPSAISEPLPHSPPEETEYLDRKTGHRFSSAFS